MGDLPEGATEFIVIHIRFRFTLAPTSSHFVRIGELEFAIRSFPSDAVGVAGIGE